MERVINFNSLKEFLIFLGKNKCCLLPNGEGAEGRCYLSKIDGKIYKIINKLDIDGKPINNYDIKKIITINDVNLVYYVLPEELYVMNGKLIGYKTKYVKDDIFLEGVTTKRICKEVYNLDEKILLSAYYRILKETDKLSDEKIKIYDLTYNLLFNGEDYYGIDTCGYHRIEEDVFKYNQSVLEEAIKENYYQLLCNYNLVLSEVLDELWDESNMEIYTK